MVWFREFGDWRPTLPTGAPTRIVEPDPGGEVGLTVPASILNEIEVVEIADDMAGASVVHSVLGREEAPICREGETVRIAQAPRDDLEVRAIVIAAEDRTRCLDGARITWPGVVSVLNGST